LIAVDASAVVFADSGPEFAASREGSMQLDDAPAAPSAAVVLRSLWQEDLIALRVERASSWVLADPKALAWTTLPATTP
jgi:hypothetical protein